MEENSKDKPKQLDREKSRYEDALHLARMALKVCRTIKEQMALADDAALSEMAKGKPEAAIALIDTVLIQTQIGIASVREDTWPVHQRVFAEKEKTQKTEGMK